MSRGSPPALLGQVSLPNIDREVCLIGGMLPNEGGHGPLCLRVLRQLIRLRVLHAKAIETFRVRQQELAQSEEIAVDVPLKITLSASPGMNLPSSLTGLPI